MADAPDTAPEGPPTLAVDGAVATITLRRPARRNALTDHDLRQFLAHLAAAEADPAVRVLVLAASTAGQPRPVFSAGYDVGGFDAGTQGPALFERVPEAIEALRPVTVCALAGSVYGGATDLVLACDLRVALAGSEFRMPAASLGLHYYPSGLRRYVTRLGADLAKRAFLAGRALAVEELGTLFERVTDAAGFDAAVAALVGRVAGLAPMAAQATKRSINEIAAGDYDVARLRERERLAAASEDFAEGRAAFAVRRPPRFSGR